MAPWNGSKASFGTNPLAFGCPREGKHPLVIDMSLSKVARGKIMGAKQRGEAIPAGWALDAAGRATTDPVAALGGTMIPVGDAKGAALALMVEILSAKLTGANHAYEASSFFEPTGSAPGKMCIRDRYTLGPSMAARTRPFSSARRARLPPWRPRSTAGRCARRGGPVSYTHLVVPSESGRSESGRSASFKAEMLRFGAYCPSHCESFVRCLI